MANLTPLQKIRAIIDENNLMTQETRVYFSTLENLIPRHGTGSPENNVVAGIGATYYDLAASAGSRHYIKINESISGDRSQGWELA